MKALVTADLHLTTTPREEYRWEIFDWLFRQGKNRKVDAFFILGDLTEKKDKHPAKLANRMVDGLIKLREAAPVWVLRGNHDYVDTDTPYFGFVNCIEGVHFISKATILSGKNTMMVPQGVDIMNTMQGVKQDHYSYIFFHDALRGAVTSSGYKMKEGTKAGHLLKAKCAAIGGDIHVPQVLRERIYYCGAPHPVYLGDDFQPRVLFIDGTEVKSIKRTTLRRVHATVGSAEEIDALDLTEGDHLKVTLVLAASEMPEWRERREKIRKHCVKRGLLLCGMTTKEMQQRRTEKRPRLKTTADPLTLLAQFSKKHDINGSLLDVGKEILKEVL
jgi:DNA repair exonuclease SbcCD nuclease subunit